MTGRSCLVVFDCGEGQTEEARKRMVREMAPLVAHVYCTLEDNDVIVQFASSCLVEKDLFKVFKDSTAEHEAGKIGNGVAASDVEASLRRFVGDDKACTRLWRSIALDRAVLLKGISFDGVILLGDTYTGLQGSKKLEDIVGAMYRLGRVVASFGKCSAIVANTLANVSRRAHHKQIEFSHTTEVFSEDERGNIAPGVIKPSWNEACKDANVITASATKSRSIQEGCVLLKDAIDTYEEEAKRL